MSLSPRPRNATSPVPDAASDRVNILLVDDRPDKLLALESVLADLGQNLVRATSGREALRALLQQDFAVILLDVNMPVMDGFETAAMARQRERSERTPIIFFTAQPDAEQALFRSYKLGAVDFIRTPVIPDILKAKVSVFVELYKKTEQVKRQAEEVRGLQEREHQTRLAEATDRLEAETKRNRFFTLAVDMLAIGEFDGTFKQLNPSWEKTLGFTDDELRSRPFIEFIHSDDQPGTLEHLERLRTGAPSTYFEHRFACKGGGYRWLGWTAAPFLSEGLLYVFSRDLTDRKVAEEERVKRIREQTARAAAEASERRSAFLAEATGSLSGSLDEAEILGGLTALAVPGLADWCFVDSVDEQNQHRRAQITRADPAALAIAERIASLSLAESSGSAQARVMRDGRSVLIRTVGEAGTDAFTKDPDHHALVEALAARSMLVVPLRCRDRSLAALTFVSTDPLHCYDREDLELADELARRAALAVDNAHLYKTSQEARKAAETANRAKDEFLATLSHELRTPLTPILGWTVMLRSGTLDQASMIRGLEVIERNVRAQTQLIGDLLDVSRIITGKLRLEVRPVDISPVIEAGVEAVRSSAEAKDIGLELDLPQGMPEVNADPDRLQQVVWNLVSNAVKFTAAGGRVEVRLRRAQGRIQIAVSDTGKGISASFLPFVFDRFRQADSTSTRTHGGLGLGLAIVRHLVELHGGTVNAESPGEGRGSTFTVELPLVADPLAATVEPRLPLGANGRDPALRLDGVRVLLLDDASDTRDFLCASLMQYGAEVTALASPGEALQILEHRRPDVLVSDIGTPGEDGYAFIRSVRALGPERGGQVPAAALTAYAKGEDGTRVLSAGFQVHLAKPVEPLALAQAVATLAGRPSGNI